jgi:hypothetical protein
MWKTVSIVSRVVALLAIPVALQGVGSKYMAQGLSAAKAPDANSIYALLRDGMGTPGVEPRNMGLEGLESVAAALNPKSKPIEKSLAAPDPVPARSAMLMRYGNTDARQGKKGKSSVVELPPGTSVLFLDGKLQVYHPVVKSNAEDQPQ